MRTNLRRILGILAKALALPMIILVSAGEAHATSRWIHASVCQAEDGSTKGVNSAGQVHSATTGSVVLICPMISDATANTTTTTALQVYGFANAANAVSVRACATPSGGGPASCTNTPASNSSPGAFTILLNPRDGVGGWYSNFAYVEITMQPAISGSFNTLFGLSY